MKQRRLRSMAVLAMVAAIAIPACGGDVAPLGESTAASDSGGHWEAVLLAESASSPLPADTNLVRLDGVDSPITVFTDRPRRLSGEIEVVEFLSLWHAGSFSSDPPNAAIVSGGTVTTVELVGAVFDRDSSTLWLDTRPLDDEAARPGAPVDTSVGSGPVQVFIDAFSVPVNSQVTDSITQTNVKVLGKAPAMSLSETAKSIAESHGIQTSDLASSRAQMQTSGQAVTDAGVRQILSESQQ